MNIGRLIGREIWFRKFGFVLSAFSVLTASALFVGLIVLLQQYDLDTEQYLASEYEKIKKIGEKDKDDARKRGLKLGFNLQILPKGIDLIQFYDKDYANKFMPEEYATKLANSPIITVNHLLPVLQQRVEWNEEKITINLIGTRGEEHIASRKKKSKEIQQAVPPNQMILGFGLRQRFEENHNTTLKKGDKVQLRGRTFTIYKLYAQRNNRDNITAWLNLEDAQDMLNKQGKINGILALGCDCTAGRLSNIRKEVSKILPDTQVEEYLTRAVVRAEERNAAAKRAKDALKREENRRAEDRGRIETLGAVIMPLALIGCGLWLGFLALDNVNRRRNEIGVLRAVGMRSGQLLAMFLGRALIVGFCGSLLGFFVGAVIGAACISVGGFDIVDGMFYTPWLLPVVLVAATVISALACWIPSLLAVRQDPAVVLQPD